MDKTILNVKQWLFLIVYTIMMLLRYVDGIGGSEIFLRVLTWGYIIIGISGIFIFKELLAQSIDSWKKNITKGLIILAAVFLIKAVATVIASIPQGWLYPDYESINQKNIEYAILSMRNSKALLVAAIGIFGPITEEIIYRGILVGKLKQKLPKYVCVILSSVLFMLGHNHAFRVEEFLYNLPILFTGIIFSITYIKTNNLSLCVLVHILTNLPAVIMLSFSILSM